MVSVAVVVVVLSIGVLSQQTLAEKMADNQIAYFFPTQTVARAKPDTSAPIVNTYPAFSFALVKNTAPGWVYVEPLPDAKTQEGGWIEPLKENLSCCDGVLPLAIRREEMRGKPWPAPVKLDIMRGKVRVGFTIEQVRLAYTTSPSDTGNPLRKAIEETAAGTVETWTYQDATYTMKGGRVVKINRIE
jgi:hypothetical protein